MFCGERYHWAFLVQLDELILTVWIGISYSLGRSLLDSDLSIGIAYFKWSRWFPAMFCSTGSPLIS